MRLSPLHLIPLHLSRQPRHRAITALALAVVLAGCAELPTPEGNYPSVRLAARNAAKDVASQLKQAGWRDGAIWVSPAISQYSGEITASGRELQVLMAMDLKTLLGDAVVQSVGVEESAAFSWVLAPSVRFEKPDKNSADASWFKIDVAVLSPAGKSLPGVKLGINAQQFDATPSRFFRDSPLFLTGTYHETRQEFAKGAKSTLSLEKRQRFISVEGKIQDAILKFEAGKPAEAASQFSQVVTADPENLPALSGRYQSLLEVGKPAEAELALASLIEAALKQGNISLRFLFQVRSTEFRDDLEITRRYQSWLKQLATKLDASGRCLAIFGHASRTGSFEFNQQLSGARARHIMELMTKHAPGLKGRLSSEGRSYADNVVGSGTDDATDAIDRRVDFKLVPCK